MFKRLMRRWTLMNEAGGADTGGAPAAAAATPAAEAPAAQSDAALTPPASLLGDGKGEAAAPEGTEKPGDQKPEQKPEDQSKPEEPVKYEAFKLPEGMTLDETKLGEFTKLAGEAKVSQEVAQKLVDLYADELKAVTEAPYRAWSELQNQWRTEVKEDPVIGGANLDKNLAATKAGLNALLGEEAPKFYEALNVTGAGNNPAILRGLFKAAAPHAPATPVAGTPGNLNGKSAGEKLYPNQAKLGNGHEG